MGPSENRRSPEEAPPRARVEEQLQRLLGSESFAGALRSQRFLSFIVEQTLAGRTDRLHGYTIGVEVFDRPEDFDPQADPIVRVEAGRLRQRLERHYLTEGVDDPILIEAPKGGYVPEFTYQTSAEPSGASPDEVGESSDSAASASRRTRLLAVTVSLGLVAVAVVYGAWRIGRMASSSQPRNIGHVSSNNPVRAVVMPFDYKTTSQSHPFLTSGLEEETIATLATLPGVEVIAPGSAARAAEDELTSDEIARVLQVDYVIRGSVRQEGDRLRITVNVEEPASSLVRLSKSFDGSSRHILDLQAEVARGLAGAVSKSVTPAVEDRLRATGMRNPEALALYHEATTLRDPPSDPVRSHLAEVAFRRVIELDPDFAGGYAGLAYVLAYRSGWGMSEQRDTDIQEALESARTAVDKNPRFGWAQMSLSIALNVTGDHEGSLEAARRAAVLSPSDPYVLAFSGLYQAFAGDIDTGAELAASAIRLDPLSPRTPYRNIAGATHFHAGRFVEALAFLTENLRLGGPDGPHSRTYRAATLARLGRIDDARRELEMAEAFPYDFDMRDFLAAFRDPREADTLFESLSLVGLDPDGLSAFSDRS
jgi:TolB-like protein/tetratricopeptide (TPR) repeat protein